MAEDPEQIEPGGVPGPVPAPRIGLWGTFDLENYGDILYPRILQLELARRLPEARIKAFGPVGGGGPNRFEETEPAEPLGPWTLGRLTQLAEALDLVVVGPGEIIHTKDELLGRYYGLDAEEMRRRAPSRFLIEGLGPDLEQECPVAWLAVGLPYDVGPDEAPRFRDALAMRASVSVRDEVSRRRLQGAGVERDVEVIPDPGFLLLRLFPPDLLAKRLAYLRTMGWYPASGAPLVVQGNEASLPRAPALVGALERLREERGGLEVVVVETGPCHGDGRFAEAVADALPGARRIPSAGLADLTAAIGASAGFVGTSLHGNVAALVQGRPHLTLAWGGESKLLEFARLIENPDCLVERPEDVPGALEKAEAVGSPRDLLADLQRRVDAHLDGIAQLAAGSAARRRPPSAASQPPPEEELVRLRRAHAARGWQLVALRWALADRADELKEELDILRDRIRHLEEELAGRTRELQDLRNTRTFRYTARLRALYGALLRLLRRR